jgi:hypothetical protein
VRPDVVEQLLGLAEYRSLTDVEVIYRAKVRLGLARLGAITAIQVHDRATAIAVLEGIRDNTAAGMVA